MIRRDFLKNSTLAGAAARIISPQGIALAQSGSSSFQAGFADRDITPEIGMEQPGGYGKSYIKSFHDACKVRAAVFDDGKTKVALVGVDACSIPRQLVQAARKEISRECGIPEQAVLIGASHSHSSGPVMGVLPGQYDDAPPLVQRLAYEKSTCINPVYMLRVQSEIVTAVSQAHSFRKPALCAVASGTESKAAHNRRFRMKNGLTITHPTQGNPDIVEPAGPTDPQVGVLGAWDQDGRLLGCIVNYACHATTSPGGISANWIYYLEKTIRGAMDATVPVVFLQGASGDLVQTENLSPYLPPTGERWAQLVGGRVGAEAVKAMLTVQAWRTWGSLGPLDAKSTLLRIPRRKPAADRVQRCYAMVEKDPKEVGASNWTFAKEIVMLDALIKKEPVVDVEVQAIQVGPAVFLTNPSEFFCQFGLDIKKQSPFPFTFPVELANGSVGYVPTEEAFGPHGGGYETRLTSYSNLQISAGRQMVDAAVELARSMTPGKMPDPPKPPPYKAPWDYGNARPELE